MTNSNKPIKTYTRLNKICYYVASTSLVVTLFILGIFIWEEYFATKSQLKEYKELLELNNKLFLIMIGIVVIVNALIEYLQRKIINILSEQQGE
jgi:cytochrome b subunit of formate dehydrogenase